MDAVEFIEERNRMCKSFEVVCCKGCPAFNAFEDNLYCAVDQESTLDATAQIAMVEKWSAEHTRKTRQSAFLEQYHNAPLDNNGILQIRPCYIDKNFIHSKGANYCNTPCEICRRDYWSEEVE